MKKSELRKIIKEEIQKLIEKDETIQKMTGADVIDSHEKHGIQLYRDMDTDEVVYMTMKGDSTWGLFDTYDQELANERSRKDIKSSYNLKPISYNEAKRLVR